MRMIHGTRQESIPLVDFTRCGQLLQFGGGGRFWEGSSLSLSRISLRVLSLSPHSINNAAPVHVVSVHGRE